MTIWDPNDYNVSDRGYILERFARKILKSLGFKIIIEHENQKQAIVSIYKKINQLEFCNEWEETQDNITIFHKDFRKLTKEQRTELARLKKDLKGIQETDSNVKILGKTIYPKNSLTLSENVNMHEKIPSYVDYLCKKDGQYYLIDIKHKKYKENNMDNRYDFTAREVLNYNRLKIEGKINVKILLFLLKGTDIKFKVYDWSDFSIPKGFDPNHKNKTSARLNKNLDLQSFSDF